MSHANLDTASKHVGYINKTTGARPLKQAFSCMANWQYVQYNNLLVSFIIYEARYKEYHHQKLALESSNFCHTPAYLATLLHLNNAKDVKELVAYTKKMLQRFFAV